MVTDLPNTFHFNKNEKPSKINISKMAKTDRTPIAAFQEDQSELEYCRSFERKTHKYSINDVELFDKDDTPFQ